MKYQPFMEMIDGTMINGVPAEIPDDDLASAQSGLADLVALDTQNVTFTDQDGHFHATRPDQIRRIGLWRLED